MLHGREKSDSAIVAGKPTNKAVLTAAEPVERRAGAKGNARQQSTDRAQNRATVSQALDDGDHRKTATNERRNKFRSLMLLGRGIRCSGRRCMAFSPKIRCPHGRPPRSGCITQRSNTIRTAPTPNTRSATHGGRRRIR
jgi:hypothetical protein